MSHRGRFDANDLLAAHLAAGLSVKDAAAAARVCTRTAQRRLNNPLFRAQVQALRDQMVGAAAGALAAALGRAVGTLTALLDDASPAVRLRAAVQVTELAFKARELVDLQTQVAELRDAADAGPNHHTGNGETWDDAPE